MISSPGERERLQVRLPLPSLRLHLLQELRNTIHNTHTRKKNKSFNTVHDQLRALRVHGDELGLTSRGATAWAARATATTSASVSAAAAAAAGLLPLPLRGWRSSPRPRRRRQAARRRPRGGPPRPARGATIPAVEGEGAGAAVRPPSHASASALRVPRSLRG